MPRTVTVTAMRSIDVARLSIARWVVDYDEKAVTMTVREENAEGAIVHTFNVKFWLEMPDPGTDPEGNPITPPGHWFNLPAETASDLIALGDMALNAIVNRLYT